MAHPPKSLALAATAALAQAHAPYSRFRVGAALETHGGERFAGCNVENASYGLTVCAERSAAAAAVLRGHRRFRRIVVATESEHAVPPCGACRQFLAEFGTDLEVFGVGKRETKRWSLRQLLPDAFEFAPPAGPEGAGR